MIEIRNLLFQPLSLHLAGEEGGIHLGSRERKVISDDQLSEEIRVMEARGFVSLSEVAENTQPDPRVETTDDEPCPEPSRTVAAEPASADNRTVAKPKRRRER